MRQHQLLETGIIAVEPGCSWYATQNRDGSWTYGLYFVVSRDHSQLLYVGGNVKRVRDLICEVTTSPARHTAGPFCTCLFRQACRSLASF